MKTSVRVTVQDANILIDLMKADLLAIFFSQAYEFITTDLVLDELHIEQQLPLRPYIVSGKLRVIAVDHAALIAINKLLQQYKRLSLQDCSAMHFAESLDAILMTGDGCLRRAAQGCGIQVCGMLRILDELVSQNLIEELDACQRLRQLMRLDRRLPADECIKRISSWCKGA